jgi:hypothetical protein
MSNNEVPFQPEYGPPAPSRASRIWRLRRWPRAALAGGVIAVLALVGGGIAFAASSSSSSTTTPPTTTPAHPFAPRGFGGFGGFRGFGPAGLPGGLGAVVHGQFTVRAPSGKYQTVDVQVGKVTAVSSTSLTLTSTDGYTHTYVVTASTVVDAQRGGISSVAKQDQLEVLATQSGSKQIATNITDLTKIQSSRNGFGLGPFGAGRGGGPAPAPANGGSATTGASVS